MIWEVCKTLLFTLNKVMDGDLNRAGNIAFAALPFACGFPSLPTQRQRRYNSAHNNGLSQCLLRPDQLLQEIKQ